MADEASNIVLLGNKGDPVEVIVADGASIPKNTLMQITSSPQTVEATDGASQLFFGIFNEEKVAGDGRVKFSVLTHCIANLTCGAGETMNLGAPVMTGAVANEVDVATVDTVEGGIQVVGMALEDVANNGTGAVLINVGRRR